MGCESMGGGVRGTEVRAEGGEGSKPSEEARGEGRKGVWKGEMIWRSQTTMAVSLCSTVRCPTRWGPNSLGRMGASCRGRCSRTSQWGG